MSDSGNKLGDWSKTMSSIECQVYCVGETSHMAEISNLCPMVMFDSLSVTKTPPLHHLKALPDEKQYGS